MRDDGITVDYVVDLAELPTVQTMQRIDLDGDGKLDPTEGARYRTSECAHRARRDRRVARRATRASHLRGRLGPTLAGQGGLQTLRLECPLRGVAALGDGADLAFQDGNFTDRIGWREITLAGDGTTVSGTDAPARSVSDRLLAYPTDGRSPLRQLELSATVERGGPPLDPAATGPAQEPLGCRRPEAPTR